MQTFFKADYPSRIDERLSKKAETERVWRLRCKQVDFRDGKRCRACHKRANPDLPGLLRGQRHHIVYRSAGGTDDSSNLVTLCACDHNDEHQSRLKIEILEPSLGADGCLAFWRRDDRGEWFLSKREIAVGRFELD